MFEFSEEMLTPEYWLRKLDNADKVIMTQREIENFNGKIINKVATVYNLETYENNLKKDELIKLIKSYEIPKKPMYDKYGNLIKKDFYEDIIKNTNLEEVEDVNSAMYGLAIKNTSLRSFPTKEAIFDKQGDIEIDRFQETGCQALEPVIILHKSKDKKWLFIQMYNYRGWVKAEDIAIAKNKKELFDYVNSYKFLIVTGNYIKTQYNPFDKSISKLEFTMGTKIYLEEEKKIRKVGNQSVEGNYLVKLPIRNKEGNLEFRHALISKKEDVNVGYLPYTRENILKQAFKLLGDRYGWGDSLGGRDCSSYIMYVFKTFGIRLPRNANEQEASGDKSYKFTEGMSIEERIKVFGSVKPGALVYMPGHAMIYIGKEKGIPYIIHDFHGYGEKKGDKYEFVPVNEVMVTSSLLTTISGVPFIEKFTSVLEIE
ncbi:NLP/P60 protein [Thermoanaerobacter italicus Ab9]|uniref:NLP/P60 protein n=1 Tax=Thermoanaerobacter italicus (strain DSM 9252 / Ab9) TaxID=580331 RepID=D3T5P3_THEIA|nr:SH3 domain-containing protein [Thermoanaerobacter italicus]ADD03416.1 NLP/P60 protein [Thermoanaerobacter italicus Ab9]